MSHLIRKYTREDTEDIKKCLVELQDFERLMDPKRLEGVRIAHEYLEHLLTLCENGNGIFSAPALARRPGAAT